MSFITKNVIRKIAREYKLTTPQREEFFNVLWEVFQVGNKYKREHKDDIQNDLEHNYRCIAAAILNKDNVEINSIRHDFSRNNVFKKIKTLALRDRTMTLFKSNSPTSITIPQKPDKLFKYVIFSDHHITPLTHTHNYFSEGQNKNLYMAVLEYYSDNDFGLIENGDVEEYTIFEPTDTIINRYNNLVDKDTILGVREDIGSIVWSDLIEERINNRINILTQILDDHKDLYDLINTGFASKGKRYYTKITGNHDPYCNPRLIDVLPDFLKDNLCDALRINEALGMNEPKYFITHGHQFDTSTLPQHAFAVGEVFSETLGWFIQGADRIWNEAKTNQWRNPELASTFRNILATAKNDGLESVGIAKKSIEIIIEILMQNHEIAWEYFDNQNKAKAFTKEVLTGDEYFKVRHLSETRLVEALSELQDNSELSSFKYPTKLIIGHTHEPRLNSRTGVNNDNIVSNYINTGSAGRFDNLIWGVELIDGKEKVISWTNIGGKNNIILRRDEWIATSDGRFEKVEYPL